MLLTNCIDAIVQWLETDVCPKIQLKLPDDYKNDASYDVQYVNPSALPLYVPGKDRMPPDITAPIPSICVQLLDGSDTPQDGKRKINIRLCLACWNPGKHGAESYHPQSAQGAIGGIAYSKDKAQSAKEMMETAPKMYTQFFGTGTADSYQRNMDGWRDSFNFLDLTLESLRAAEYIGGMRISMEDGIKYGLFSEDGVIWDYYPYWHNWITFSMEMGLTAAIPQKYKDFL